MLKVTPILNESVKRTSSLDWLEVYFFILPENNQGVTLTLMKGSVSYAERIHSF